LSCLAHNGFASLTEILLREPAEVRGNLKRLHSDCSVRALSKILYVIESNSFRGDHALWKVYCSEAGEM